MNEINCLRAFSIIGYKIGLLTDNEQKNEAWQEGDEWLIDWLIEAAKAKSLWRQMHVAMVVTIATGWNTYSDISKKENCCKKKVYTYWTGSQFS